MPFPTDRPQMTPIRWKQTSIDKKADIKNEKGQIPFPTDRALNDTDKVKTSLYRNKKAVIKKEECQIPFPTDRALNDADKVKTRRLAVSRQKKHKWIKKDKMMTYSSLPPTHTTCTVTVPM